MVPASEHSEDGHPASGDVEGHTEESLMLEHEIKEAEDKDASYTAIDLLSFLDFGIQATHALSVLHQQSPTINHGEIRPNAFHLSGSGVVRFAHLGNRSVSLEGSGGPSALVMAAENMGDRDAKNISQAICYLSPEQTGRTLFKTSNRTDLYA